MNERALAMVLALAVASLAAPAGAQEKLVVQ